MPNYKTILEYLEYANPDLADVISNLSLQYLFNAKGKRGVTLLLMDKLDDLVDLSLRDDTESAERVIDVLQAHIIYDVFKTPIEFLQREALNGHNRALDIDNKKSSKAEIKLLSGGTFGVDTGFTDGSKSQNLSVFKFKGELLDHKSGVEPKSAPVDNTPTTRKKSQRPPTTPAPPKLMVDSIRFRIGVEVSNSATYRLIHGADNGVDEYAIAVLSMVQFLNTHNELSRLCLFGKVLPLVSGIFMADFYLIFEPHTTLTDAQYLIPEEMLTQWYQWRRTAKVDPGKVLETISGILDRPGAFENAAIYRDRVSLLEAIDDNIRRKIKCDSLSQDKLVSECITRYTGVANTNTIGMISGVYPGPLADIYKSDPCRKLLEDEFRHYIYLTTERLYHTSHDQLSVELRELDEKIADYLVNMHRGKFIDSKDRLRLLSPSVSAVHRSDSRRQFICEMINSTNFMFIPVNRKDLDPQRFPHDVTMSRPRRDRIEYWSIAHAVNDMLGSQYKTVTPNRKSAVKMLSKILSNDVDDIDDDARARIEETLSSIKTRKSGVSSVSTKPSNGAKETTSTKVNTKGNTKDNIKDNTKSSTKDIFNEPDGDDVSDNSDSRSASPPPRPKTKSSAKGATRDATRDATKDNTKDTTKDTTNDNTTKTKSTSRSKP